jgi:hypothetical protein
MSRRRFRKNFKSKPQGAAIGMGSIVDIEMLAPIVCHHSGRLVM